jgi:Cys-rich four helix bundle protein (predicted Tat secretion target)
MSEDKHSSTQKSLSRREMLIGLGAATAAVYSGSAMSEMKGHEHHDHSKHDHSKHRPQLPDLLSAVNECMDMEKRCLAHCLVAFQEGDTELAKCAAKVHETHAICQGFSTLLTANSEYLKDYARLCEKACKDCEDECRKHEKNHRECRDCANACANVIDQIKLRLS